MKKNNILYALFLLLFISIQSFAQNEIKRNPDTRKDYVNVMYNSKYTLFDLWSDEPIYPNSEGVYSIYTATNEDKTPHLLIGKAADLEWSITYKFKNRSNCQNWCDGKIFNEELLTKSLSDKKQELDFGISKISFLEEGNKSHKRLNEGYILEWKLRKSFCYLIGNYIENSQFYDSLLGKDKILPKITELLALKLNIDTKKEISPVLLTATQGLASWVTKETFKGKTSLDVLLLWASTWLKNYTSMQCYHNSNIINVEAYDAKSEEEKQAELNKQLQSEIYEDGARNYCISTSNSKYVMSLFDDGTRKVIYKLFNASGKLIKTMQGVWSINDQGVYGSSYVLTTTWTGLNSNLPQLKFTCQYNASGILQAIIDSQHRNWFICN
jgi:hypothetical protein